MIPLGEPDYLAWMDLKTGLHCRIKRIPYHGHLCGYVGVPKEHPSWGVGLEKAPFDVHGGITYSEMEGETWWFGFDCAHAGDLIPGSPSPGHTYKDIEYVKRECMKLAEQLYRRSTMEELPEHRKAAAESSIAEYIKQYHLVAAERDALLKDITNLRAELTLAKIAIEAKDSIILDLESRMSAAYLIRDDAVAERERLFATCTAIKAILNELAIPSSPLIKETPHEGPRSGDDPPGYDSGGGASAPVPKLQGS